jgi:glycosyltransferase involved in cell wall biosynthesis
MRQGLDDFEIVIVDNASQDDTEALVGGLNNRHIRYFRNSENFGPHYSSKRCLAEAVGRYIKYLCADDVLLDGVLLKQLEILRRRPEVSLVSCDMYITDSDLHNQKLYHFFPGLCSGPRLKNVCLSRLGNFIGGPSNFMFRRAGTADLVFDSSYHAIGDLKFALQLLERGAYANIDEPGYLYRRHPNSDSVVGVTAEMHRFEFMRLVDEYDWWNPLSCLVAIWRVRSEWRKTVTEKWIRAFLPSHVLHAFTAFSDSVRLYVRNSHNQKDNL